MIKKIVHLQDRDIIKLSEEEKKIGYIEFSFDKYENILEVVEIYVEPEYRRHGYGTILMNEYKKEAERLKCGGCLHAHPFKKGKEHNAEIITNKALETFYSKFGFKEYVRLNNGGCVMKF